MSTTTRCARIEKDPRRSGVTHRHVEAILGDQGRPMCPQANGDTVDRGGVEPIHWTDHAESLAHLMSDHHPVLERGLPVGVQERFESPYFEVVSTIHNQVKLCLQSIRAQCGRPRRIIGEPIDLQASCPSDRAFNAASVVRDSINVRSLMGIEIDLRFPERKYKISWPQLVELIRRAVDEAKQETRIEESLPPSPSTQGREETGGGAATRTANEASEVHNYLAEGNTYPDGLDKDERRESEHEQPASLPTADGQNIFRKRGEIWDVRFQGTPQSPIQLRSRSGMYYIHRLLERQGKDIPALELCRTLKAVRTVRVAGVEQAAHAQGSPSEDVIDQDTLSNCNKRLSEIDGELADVERNHDEAAVERLTSDREAILAYIGEAARGCGKPRKFADAAERARKAVSANMKTATDVIREHLPALADHFDTYISRGRIFVYAPPTPIDWEL